MEEGKEVLHKIIDRLSSKTLTLMNIKICAQVVRQGSDITLVGWGAQLSIMEQACADAEKVSGCCIASESA